MLLLRSADELDWSLVSQLASLVWGNISLWGLLAFLALLPFLLWAWWRAVSDR